MHKNNGVCVLCLNFVTVNYFKLTVQYKVFKLYNLPLLLI